MVKSEYKFYVHRLRELQGSQRGIKEEEYSYGKGISKKSRKKRIAT